MQLAATGSGNACTITLGTSSRGADDRNNGGVQADDAGNRLADEEAVAHIELIQQAHQIVDVREERPVRFLAISAERRDRRADVVEAEDSYPGLESRSDMPPGVLRRADAIAEHDRHRAATGHGCAKSLLHDATSHGMPDAGPDKCACEFRRWTTDIRRLTRNNPYENTNVAINDFPT